MEPYVMWADYLYLFIYFYLLPSHAHSSLNKRSDCVYPSLSKDVRARRDQSKQKRRRGRAARLTSTSSKYEDTSACSSEVWITKTRHNRSTSISRHLSSKNWAKCEGDTSKYLFRGLFFYYTCSFRNDFPFFPRGSGECNLSSHPFCSENKTFLRTH